MRWCRPQHCVQPIANTVDRTDADSHSQLLRRSKRGCPITPAAVATVVSRPPVSAAQTPAAPVRQQPSLAAAAASPAAAQLHGGCLWLRDPQARPTALVDVISMNTE